MPHNLGRGGAVVGHEQFDGGYRINRGMIRQCWNRREGREIENNCEFKFLISLDVALIGRLSQKMAFEATGYNVVILLF